MRYVKASLAAVAAALGQVNERRRAYRYAKPLVADYKGDPITEEEALWALQHAKTFLEEVEKRFFVG